MKQTTVADVMTRRVMAARQDAKFKEIVEVLQAAHISALPILDSEDHVIGVVSEGDLLVKEAAADREHRPRRHRHAAEEDKASEVQAAGLMTQPAVTIGRDATVAEAARTMSDHKVKRLPVVDDWGHLIGIVSRVDVLTVFSRDDTEIRDEVTDIITRKFSLDPHAVEVSVKSGIVTVTGQVEISASVPYLLDDITHVEAVVDVRNRLSYPHEDRGHSTSLSAFSFPLKG